MRTHGNERGQSILEYSVLIAVIVLVIVVGQIYFKRSLAGRWKDTAEQFGEQFTTKRDYVIETRQQSFRNETTATPENITAGDWTSSFVGSKGDFTAARIDLSQIESAETAEGYTGHETTRKDYVNATVKGHVLGAHGTFDSGKLSGTKLFDDD